MALKLNIGSGNRQLKGFVNIDLHHPSANLKLDCSKILPFSDNSIDEIAAIHVIEHFSFAEWRVVKKDWYRILKPGARLLVSFPDIDSVVEKFLHNTDNQKWEYWLYAIYGSQRDGDPGQFHKNAFNLERITNELQAEGFKVTDFKRFYGETPDPNGFCLQVVSFK